MNSHAGQTVSEIENKFMILKAKERNNHLLNFLYFLIRFIEYFFVYRVHKSILKLEFKNKNRV